MKSKWKSLFQLVIAIIIILLITQLELITYGLRQARGQFGIIYGAVDIEKALADNKLSDSIKQNLQLVKEVKSFATEGIGLNETDIYGTINLEKGRYTMYVVTGSLPYQLTPYLWEFPVAGEVPYKGFFDLELAKKERNKIRALGWDASIRTAGGWSTLGWFENPLLYEMMEREKGDLVNLVIHEMAHETIYVKDSSTLNENIATFIGDASTLLYLEEKFGRDSGIYKSYIENEEDSKRFADYFIYAANKLDSLYDSFSRENENKESLKTALIGSIVDNLDTVAFHNPQKFKDILPKNYLITLIFCLLFVIDLVRITFLKNGNLHITRI